MSYEHIDSLIAALCARDEADARAKAEARLVAERQVFGQIVEHLRATLGQRVLSDLGVDLTGVPLQVRRDPSNSTGILTVASFIFSYHGMDFELQCSAYGITLALLSSPFNKPLGAITTQEEFLRGLLAARGLRTPRYAPTTGVTPPSTPSTPAAPAAGQQAGPQEAQEAQQAGPQEAQNVKQNVKQKAQGA